MNHRAVSALVLAGLITGTWGTMGEPASRVSCEASAERPKISSLIADRRVPGVAGSVGVQLDARRGYELFSSTVGGRSYMAAQDFPSFVVLDRAGKQIDLTAMDSRWQVKLLRQGAITCVTYEGNGLAVQVAYILESDRLNIVSTVLQEGNWKLVAIHGTVLTRSVSRTSQGDYLLDGSGWLVFPDISKKVERKWDANSDNLIGGSTTASFVAWRERGRIVFVKPLTFSHWLGWTANPERQTTVFALRAGLYFRPPETRLFQTKLAHEVLGMRIETAGDVNNDGQVDWVDAGIAYRERYIKTHINECFRYRLRDAFRVYYAVDNYPSYDAAFKGLLDIDFASGIWWVKGMMEPASWDDSESHKFAVKPNPRLGLLFTLKQALNKKGQWVGPYYGHDYITLQSGDWPDEFIKRDPNDRPFLYSAATGRIRAKFYKDNVRSVATGAVFRHYEQILEACLLQRGDPIMLDTFSAFARSGYHPDYPATPELEMQAKHRIAEFLHDKKGLLVAGEGLVEGLQDVVDYGAIALEPIQTIKHRIWERRNGIQQVPMLPVVFQGASYYGANWYEFRNPNPNWAVGLVYGVGYWDWLPEGPAFAWTRFARYYFYQNLIWAQISDSKVRDVKQNGSQFTFTYDNGATLWADVDANRWVLSKGGVRYDGFTPFNNRGYMAVLMQGDFEITLPGNHQLEVFPHQPFRDQITFQCLPKKDRTVIRGRFGHLKWRIPILKVTPEGKEMTEYYKADPVLVLREINPPR